MFPVVGTVCTRIRIVMDFAGLSTSSRKQFAVLFESLKESEMINFVDLTLRWIQGGV